MNGWQDLMNLLDTLYRIGKARQKAARDAEGLALRQDIARLGCKGRFFNARWPRLHEGKETVTYLNSYSGRN